MGTFRLVDACIWRPGEGLRAGELCVAEGRVAAQLPAAAPSVGLGGRVVLPGLVNGHDHLDLGSFPALGRPPYASLYAWAADVRAGAGDPSADAALAVPFLDRVFLGALRNLLCGVTSVAQHGAWHRAFRSSVFRLSCLARHRLWMPSGLPVRVLERYGWAHSPGLDPDLKRRHARTPRDAPFMIHVGEGTDAQARAEVEALEAAGMLTRRTVVVHGLAVSDADVARLRAAGSAVVWCPESNRFLYDAKAPIAALRQAGVRLGLGSDSALSGVRDFLSTLALARREALFDDDALLALATRDTAALLGLPAGDLSVAAAADLVVVDDLEHLLTGDRASLALVLRAGRPLLGEPSLVRALGADGTLVDVGGRSLLLERGFARLLRRLLRRHEALRQLPWLRDVRVHDTP